MRTQTYHAVQLLVAERDRQIEEEGWTASHDDEHDDGALATAAGVYALIGGKAGQLGPSLLAITTKLWPWDRRWLKVGDRSDRARKSCLVKAGALIIAELEAWERDRVAKCCAMGPHALNPVALLLATADRIARVRATHAHLERGK